MDFGKLPSVDHVDFRLPAEPQANARVLAKLPKPDRQVLYLGPTGYNMKPWVGKWYPPGAREQDFLRHYSALFNTIEFNTTHYRMPDSLAVSRWKSAVSADFRFCPKVPQSISHDRSLGLAGTEPDIFCEAVNLFDHTLGCSFLQLPPQFGPRELPLLERFLSKFSPRTPLAVEARNPLFFKDNHAGDGFFALLEDYNVAAVVTDVAGRRDVCHLRLTNARSLIRFVGNGLHPSDYTRVEEWAGRLQHWFDSGLHEAYFFTHEPDNLLGPELTEICFETFSKRMPSVEMRGPKPAAGQQGTLF